MCEFWLIVYELWYIMYYFGWIIWLFYLFDKLCIVYYRLIYFLKLVGIYMKVGIIGVMEEEVILLCDKIENC